VWWERGGVSLSLGWPPGSMGTPANSTDCDGHMAPNGYTCITGSWGSLEACTVAACAVYVAALLILRSRRISRVPRPTRGADDGKTDGSLPTPSTSESAYGRAAANDESQNARWLYGRCITDVLRLVAILVLLAKTSDAAEWPARGNFSLAAPWMAAMAPWVLYDCAIAVNVRRAWKAPWTPPLQRLLQTGYSAIAGLPFGTALKLLLAMALDTGYGVHPVVATALALVICTVAAGALVCCAVLGAPRTTGAILVVPTAYLAISMINTVRVLTPDPAAVGMDSAGHAAGGALWAAFPDGSWFAVLTPVWALAGGAALAAIFDLALATVDRSLDAVTRRQEMQRRVADVLPLVGSVGSGLIVAAHFDSHADARDGAVGDLSWTACVPILVCECFAVINLVAVAVGVQRARRARSPVVANLVIDAYSRKSNATDSGVATLRDSSESRLSISEDMFEGGSESSSQRRATERRSVTAYGNPYIDNPNFHLPNDDCIDAGEEEAYNLSRHEDATSAAPPKSAVEEVAAAAAAAGDGVAASVRDSVLSLSRALQGEPLTRDTVRIGMCVFVNADAADHNSGLYGDTVGCSGMVGVVSQADETDTCQVLLADGRQQWVQCQALVYVDDPASTVLSGAEWDGMPLNVYTTSDPLSGVGSPMHDETEAAREAYECIAARNVDGLRRAIANMLPGEIDCAIRRKTLLQAAAIDGQLEAVSLLLTSGANPNTVDSGGNSPLHAALDASCREDGAAIVASLIEVGCAKNACNGRGLSPLHLAAERGHTLAAELLVAMGCQVDLRTQRTSETPLFFAIKGKARKIVCLLVEQGGCDVNAADGDGDTPLHLALVMAADDASCLETAQYLIGHGANALLRNQRGMAAFDVCPADAFADIKQLFISAQVQTLLDDQRDDAGGHVKVGWRVRVRKDLQEPAHGWQGGTREDVLVVRAVRGDEVTATFIDPDIPLRFHITELERVYDTFGVKLTASTNGPSVYNVFKPDKERYWQSDGERGAHWVELELPQEVEVSALELQVHEGGVAFIPKRVEVLAGATTESLGPFVMTDVVSYGWTAMIPNHSCLQARVIRLCVRSCHESGINCRISGIRLQCAVQGTVLSVPSTLGTFTPVQWEDVSVGTESGTLLKGRYRLGRKLAKGGYGVTYAATDEDCLGETVVIKFLHRLPGLQLFRREARRLHEIQHPQIPRLKAYFELSPKEGEAEADESKFVLVMEMVQGRNLVEVLDDQGVWSEEDTRAMLFSVLAVLRFVHNKGVLHRDIKASNIMRRDADGQYFVIDFGASGTVNRSEDHKIIGTPGYMAPEVQLGKACCESDLFGLGALGLYVLTGVEPYRLIDKVRGTNPYSGALARLAEEGKVGDQTCALLNALLQADPDRRRVSLDAILGHS